jgi:hypothetical protein
MKSFLFTFSVVDAGTRYETTIPADTYSEAMRTLERNAAKTTGIPAPHWHLARTTENA